VREVELGFALHGDGQRRDRNVDVVMLDRGEEAGQVVLLDLVGDAELGRELFPQLDADAGPAAVLRFHRERRRRLGADHERRGGRVTDQETEDQRSNHPARCRSRGEVARPV
jgi:hypothetical protein